MHLTPRTLAMALIACVAGGLVLGIAGKVSPTSAATPPAPVPTTRASSAAGVDLGDALVSYPLSTPPVDEATGGAAVASASPGVSLPSAVESPPASPSMSAIPAPSPASTRPAPPATPPARANATGGEARSIKPRTRAKTPDEIGGWVAPRLRLGDTSIAPPLLTSGVIPFVTVMCSPSSACNLAGDTLTITEGAQQVTVAWHAPLAIVVGIVAGFIAILVAIATAITRAIQGRKDEPTAPAREQLALQADEREFQRIVAKEWPSA